MLGGIVMVLLEKEGREEIRVVEGNRNKLS